MINEWEEFCAYTGTVSYTASKKSDTTWLGRFTFATILEFEGMARILTVLARGYLFHSKDGMVISGNPHDRVDHARRALCAWCSVPENGKRVHGPTHRQGHHQSAVSKPPWFGAQKSGSDTALPCFAMRRQTSSEGPPHT